MIFVSQDRSFRVDYENDRFLKDDKPFRFIAGSFHYFRAIPQRWRQILRTLRAAGLNAVTTYIYTEEDLLVILRPGPFICGEREMVCIIKSNQIQ